MLVNPDPAHDPENVLLLEVHHCAAEVAAGGGISGHAVDHGVELHSGRPKAVEAGVQAVFVTALGVAAVALPVLVVALVTAGAAGVTAWVMP